MGHKIDAGAVSEYSLVWREGFDEWRPLATVPELMALLHEHRHSGPPSRTSFSSMPPFVDSRTSISESSQLTVIAAPSAELMSSSVVPDDFAPLADSLAPEGELPGALREMSQPPAPIGPPGIFEPAPRLGSFSGLPAAPDEEVSVPSVPPPAAAASAEPRRGISLGILALLFSMVVFAGVLAFLTYDRFGDSVLNEWLGNDRPAPVDAPSAVTTQEAPSQPELGKQEAAAAVHAPSSTEEAEPGATVNAEEGEAAAAAGEKAAPSESTATAASAAESTKAKRLVEPPDPSDDGPKMAPAPKPRRRRRAAPPKPVEEESAEGTLSAEEQRILDEFGSSADTAPAKIAVKKAGASQSDKKPLDGDAVRATVTTNKPRLQRCYERAIRGQQSPPSVRLDVSVTVAASGRVKAVNADGSGPGGLAECIEASVRRWRFPASSEGGPAKFPIVFSAN